MILYRILFLGLIIALNGCSLIEIPKFYQTQSEVDLQHRQQVQTFQDLLSQGWEIEIYKGKAVLIKYTKSGVLINDVFGVLSE